MFSAHPSIQSRTRHVPGQLVKVAILLVISLGLLWYSEAFSPITIFEPESTGWKLWVSYAKDLIQPFAFYFFLCLGERWLGTWHSRALVAFSIPTLLELGQLLYYQVWTGHYVGAFDPIDILMYAIGVGLAAAVEQKIFSKLLSFW
jgi:hypothetical protein